MPLVERAAVKLSASTALLSDLRFNDLPAFTSSAGAGADFLLIRLWPDRHGETLVHHSSLLLDHLFEEIIVPTEKVVEVRHGQKRATERKFFPGYVLTKVELTDEAYHLIRNTPKVTGFVGSHKKPIPISDAEAAYVLRQIKEGIERPKPLVSFEVGEQVQVSDGPFSAFNATVEEVDNTRSRLKVAVVIFGRPTPVELEFSQAKKI